MKFIANIGIIIKNDGRRKYIMTRLNIAKERLNSVMKEQNIRQIELSEKTGISKGMINHYCKGRYVPSNLNAKKIGDCLGVNPVWLMGFEAQKYDTQRIERTSVEEIIQNAKLELLNSEKLTFCGYKADDEVIDLFIENLDIAVMNVKKEMQMNSEIEKARIERMKRYAKGLQ